MCGQRFHLSMLTLVLATNLVPTWLLADDDAAAHCGQTHFDNARDRPWAEDCRLAMKLLANFVAQLTDTFNQKVSSVYNGMPDKVVGPMLLVEASAALGSPGVPPAALMALYALKLGHAFDLGDFVSGTNPPKGEVALTQTLVSLS